jgi:hypothetical protein
MEWRAVREAAEPGTSKSDLNHSDAHPSYVRKATQSRRLLRGANDRTTSDRIGKLIGDLEREQQIESER